MNPTYELNLDEPWKPGSSGRTITYQRFETALKGLHSKLNAHYNGSRSQPVILQRAYKRGAEKGRKAGTVRTTIWTSSKGWIRENLEVHEEDLVKER